MRTHHSFRLFLLLLVAAAARTGAQTPSTAPLNIPAKSIADFLRVRAGADTESEPIEMIYRGARMTVLERNGAWSKVRLADSRVGWIRACYLARDEAAVISKPAPPATTAAVTPPRPTSKPAPAATGTPTAPATGQTVTAPRQAVPAAASPARAILPDGAIKPAVRPGVLLRTPAKPRPTRVLAQTSPASASQTPPTSGFLAQSKPDPLDRPQESPAATLGDAFRLLLYLVPVMVLIVLSIRGLKWLQLRTGRLPSLRQGLVGSLNVLNARSAGGSSIRVVESVPVGAMALHLVEVRGRTLLLGAAGAGVSMLADLTSADTVPASGFQSMLDVASYEMEVEADPQASLDAVVSRLDSSIRHTRESVARNAERMRPWSDDDSTGGYRA